MAYTRSRRAGFDEAKQGYMNLSKLASVHWVTFYEPQGRKVILVFLALFASLR
jgi:hypothetical protein